MNRIAIPDDAPPVMSASRAYRTLLDRMTVDYSDTLPGSEDELIKRIRTADIVINIRASSRFTRESSSSAANCAFSRCG